MQIDYRLKAPPVLEPLTLAEVKAWLKVDHTSEDALIQLLITTARERCESMTGLSVMIQQWVAYLPYWPLQPDEGWWDGIREGAFVSEAFQAISLRYGPIRQIDAFSLFDPDGNASLYPAENYWLDPSRDRLILKTGAPIPQGTRHINALEITYTAGHEIVPGTLKAGMLKIIAHLYEHRGDEETAIPVDVMKLWQPFKRIKV